MESDREQVDLGLDLQGQDSLGNRYPSIKAMWHEMLANQDKQVPAQSHPSSPQKLEWYNKAVHYWDNAKREDYNGVLGGFEDVHVVDIPDSKQLIEKLKSRGMGLDAALDCGAGVGRVSEHLFLHYFKRVDLMEPSKNLLDKARENLQNKNGVGTFYLKGMEDFNYERKYNLVWLQWVVGHLTDNDLLRFLEKTKNNLLPGGYLVFKDNATSEHYGFYVDREDNTVARSLPYFHRIFEKAGYEVDLEERMEGLPIICMPTMKFVLKPKSPL